MKHLTSFVLTFTFGLFTVAAAPVSASDRVLARGTFTATVDFSTLSLTPVEENCLLVVEGVAEFIGTLQGIAPGRTRALVLAPCSDVAVAPPGTFKDVFISKLEFAGTVNGRPTVAEITYRGVTEIGGEIRAAMIPSDGMRGLLKVDAIVAVGGTYRGILRLNTFD